MSSTLPQAQSKQTPPDLHWIRFIAVIVLSVIISLASYLMVGPQIIFIVPVCLVMGIFCAVRRSFWSLVWIGYPFTFAGLSAWIGYKENPGYEQTSGFLISLGIGLIAYLMIVLGLWLSLPQGRRLDSSAENP